MRPPVPFHVGDIECEAIHRPVSLFAEGVSFEVEDSAVLLEDDVLQSECAKCRYDGRIEAVEPHPRFDTHLRRPQRWRIWNLDVIAEAVELEPLGHNRRRKGRVSGELTVVASDGIIGVPFPGHQPTRPAGDGTQV